MGSMAKKNEEIFFISSDSRDLYFEDTFRVLSAPEKYWIKFRYQKKWLTKGLSNELKEGVEIIILSLLGNKSGKNFELIPIRKAIIKKVVKENKLFQFYLELGDFVYLKGCNNFLIEKKPEKMVFSSESGKFSNYKVVTKNITKCSWEKTVDKLFKLKNDSFKKRVLYNITSLTLKKGKSEGKNIEIKEKQYKLYSNSDYILRIKMKRAQDSSESILKIECDDTIIKNLVSEYTLDAPRDNINIDFFTGDLKKDARFSKLVFKNTPIVYSESNEKNAIGTSGEKLDGNPKESDEVSSANKHDLNIEMKLSRKVSSYIIFGILSAIIATTTKYELYDFSKVIDFWNVNGYKGILDYSLFPLVTFFVTAILFWGYDKK